MPFSVDKIRIPLLKLPQAGKRGGKEAIGLCQTNRFRVTVIVLDSAGIGVMPNHPLVDDGANTIANVAEYYEAYHPGKFKLPHLQALGLGNLARIPGVEAVGSSAAGSFGWLTLDPVVMTDTITGHWGLMGLNTGAYPVHLKGLPAEMMQKMEAAVSQKLGTPVHFLKDGRNISGTTVLELDGDQARKDGISIVYTSSDSVFQVACHVAREILPGDSVSEGMRIVEEEEKDREGKKVLRRFAVSEKEVEKMYAICQALREVFDETPIWEERFLRVIARPFATRLAPGPKNEQFIRLTSVRRDYTLAVPGQTILDYALGEGFQTVGVGKFSDIFTGQGIGKAYPDPSEHRHLKGDMEGVDFTLAALAEASSGIIGVNLVSFDELFGHRNDPLGYAHALMEFDARLPEIFASMGDWDVVMAAADHGNDATRGLSKLWVEKHGLAEAVYKGRGTNHTREFVPLLVFGNPVKRGVNLGIHALADVGATIANYLGFNRSPHGQSFLVDFYNH